MVELGLSRVTTTRPRRISDFVLAPLTAFAERASEIWIPVGASEREQSTRAVIL
jgi:hypothetical protein